MRKLQSDWLQSFQCTGDQCPDTCCKGWGMQVDEATVAKYEAQAPELLEFVTSGEAKHIMQRDAETDYCVKFDAGWCGIHATKGSDFLGDACHFFPRVTRQLGEVALQTASMSCPEVARLALADDAQALYHEGEKDKTERLPFSIAQYLPQSLEDEASALKIHQAFLDAAMNEDDSIDVIIAKLHSVTESLALIEMPTWPMAVDFYLKNAASRLKPAESKDEDSFYLYQSLAGLVAAARRSNRPRLESVIAQIETALDAKANTVEGTLKTGAKSAQNLTEMKQKWAFIDSQWQGFFKRWLHTQLSMALFPFSGFGETLSDRITIIAVRLATIKLAMQAHYFNHDELTQDQAVTIVQSLARFMDHLADPTFSMKIYQEIGWTRPERLQAIVT